MDICRASVIVMMSVGAAAAHRARADVYTFQDADGVVHLTNVPADPRFGVLIPESMQAPSTDEQRAAQRRSASPKTQFDAYVASAAREHNLDEALLRAIITVESGYDPHAVSRRGAIGLMQLMPATAQRYGVTDLYNPVENIRAGARYLRDLMQKFNDDLTLALAAYNAGENAVIRYGNRIPPYLETRSYVPRVMEWYQRYRPETR